VVRSLLVPAVVLVAACRASITGVVYVDQNRDGIRQGDEAVVPGAVVALERATFAVTDASGGYLLDVEAAVGLVWVRVPDGFRPGAVSRPADALAPVDLPLIPLSPDEAQAPVTFVVASDSHTTADPDDPDDPWDGGDLGGAIEQAVDLPEPPRFFTIVGDITQSNVPGQFSRVNAALERTPVPWVPVAGNHDWYDGGANYRANYGVENYSFDIQDLHFIVWDTNSTDAEQVALVAADLARVDTNAMTVIVLGHGSPTDAVADQFAALGVDFMFTGHWHANRRVERAGMIEWGTQTFVMGGLDDTPSGYRVVTFTGGVPTIEHRERMVTPHLALTSPHAGSCADPAGFTMVAAAAAGASAPAMTARIDCGAPIPLAPSGGWTFVGAAPALTPGTHSITLTAVMPSGTELTHQVAIEVCTDPAAVPSASWVTSPWPQLGGGPAHEGHQLARIAPPLTTGWATTLDGTPALGTPVIDADVVVVSIADRGGGDQGGLVALDLRTGDVRWRVVTSAPVVNAPAISDQIVVVALGQGELVALALATGDELWRFDLAAGIDSYQTALWAAPTIANGVVYAGIQGKFAAIDLATGDALWTADPAPMYPWLGSRAAAAIAADTVIAPFNRTAGLFGWDATDGTGRWTNTSGATLAMNATPVIVDDTAFVANASGDVTALSLATGTGRWSRRFTDGGFDWGYSIMTAPAHADGRLFVATQWHDLVAVDAATGGELWRATSPSSPLNFSHYRSDQPGFIASPVVTGDVVWVGRPDGQLLALAAADGAELWSTNLGAPITAAPAPAGDVLIVATYDGTIRALVPGAPVTPGAVAACGPAPVDPDPPFLVNGGGGCSSPSGANPAVILLALLLLARRRART
jgi:outer membrane protein assembly factor BamB